ncbi:MAG: hypothetical protein K2X39_01810 [Silvanigrellaceae bacterium]|nr:hypothetical protein [Silvanigrellaceae bacterium]
MSLSHNNHKYQETDEASLLIEQKKALEKKRESRNKLFLTLWVVLTGVFLAFACWIIAF